MITTLFSAFDGKVTFECGFRTPGTENRSTRLYIALKQTGVLLTEADQRTAATLLMMMVATASIVVTDETAPQLYGLKAFWDFVKTNVIIGPRRIVTEQPDVLIEMWTLYEDCVSSEVWNQWVAAYSNANVLYPASRVEVPDAALTREEQDDPDLQKKDETLPRELEPGQETSLSA